MYRFTAVCVVSAICLAPAMGQAAAKVKSHSNTNNNRFSSQCAGLGGKAVDTPDGSSCALPASGAPSMPVKGSDVPANLTAACAQDGGKIARKSGSIICLVDKSGAAMN